MEFKPLSEIGKGKRKRRILISGEPLTRKTTSLLTFPGPRHIMSFPGEKGYDTLPTADPDTKTYIYEYDPSDPKRPASYEVVRVVRDTTIKILSGSFGPIHTFAGDGLHKLYEFFLDKASGGAYFSGTTRTEVVRGEEKVVSAVEGLHYGIAQQEFLEYVSLVCNSSVPVVGFTVWSGPEKERQAKPGERVQDIPSRTYPDLPGTKLPKRILGEFSVVVGAVLKTPKPAEPPIGVWQLTPDAEVGGVGIHAEPNLMVKLPKYIQADYRILERLLEPSQDKPN